MIPKVIPKWFQSWLQTGVIWFIKVIQNDFQIGPKLYHKLALNYFKIGTIKMVSNIGAKSYQNGFQNWFLKIGSKLVSKIGSKSYQNGFQNWVLKKLRTEYSDSEWNHNDFWFHTVYLDETVLKKQICTKIR